MNESIKLAINAMTLFTKDEFEMIKQYSALKIQAKLKSNMSISNYGNSMTSTEKETLGIAGEIAFCRMIGLPDPDEKSIINNCAYDFKINGKTIDVKSTTNMNPRLAINTGRLYKNYADVFILIRQRTHYEYIFLGCALKENFIQPENIMCPVGYKNNVYITKRLKDLEL